MKNCILKNNNWNNVPDFVPTGTITKGNKNKEMRKDFTHCRISSASSNVSDTHYSFCSVNLRYVRKDSQKTLLLYSSTRLNYEIKTVTITKSL